jgi:serine/threonine-protein kinase
VLVVIALLVAGGLVASALGVFGSKNITVPDLTGMTQATATAKLEALGLAANPQITQDYSDTVPVGQVMSQSPAKGASEPKGTAVALVLSKGPQPVGVPDVVGMTTDVAVSTLQAQGFVPVPGTPKYDAKAPEGQIISQNPAAGTEVTKGSQVTYVASKGIQVNLIPDVTGASKSSAISALEKAGFKVSVSYDFDPTVSSGDVISQDPASGGSYPPKTTVSITVSQGAGVLVPDVTSYTALDQAIAKIKSLGLKASPSSSDTTVPVTISGTDPSTGTRVVKGTTVTIHYSE